MKPKKKKPFVKNEKKNEGESMFQKVECASVVLDKRKDFIVRTSKQHVNSASMSNIQNYHN